MYRLRPAGVADIDVLMSLRAEAEEWLRRTAGTDQWSDKETGKCAIAQWRQAVRDGHSWVLLDQHDTPVGTVSRGPADPDFWSNADQPETGFYMYKLIIRRASAGLGLGSLVLDWASRVAALEGRDWVRIDCWRTNRRLQQYYESQGFQHVRTEVLPHRKSGWLAQRPAGLILNRDRSLLVDPHEGSTQA